MSHPQGETGLTRRDDGIALILIAEPPKKVIKLAIHLGNPGLVNVSQQSSEADTGTSGLVLIVVDDERQARNIKDYLILHEIAAETAPNGFAAINAVKQLQPAIVLLDIRMPGIDGIEVTRHILRLDTSPTVILMSGYPESIHDANVAQLGVFAVVQKPLPLKIVAAFVRRAFAAWSDETPGED